MLTAEVTIEGDPFDLAAYIKSVEGIVNKYVSLSLKDFNATKDTFRSPNTVFDFEVQKAHREGDSITGSVSTDNLNYTRLNNGTGARPRTAKTARGMSFRHNYKAKTSPRRLTSTSSARSGRWVSGIKHVRSGPIQAREFDITVKDKYEPGFNKEIQSIKI